MRTSASWCALAGTGAVLLLGACGGGDAQGPVYGSVTVSVVMTGAAPDRDGFQVVVDDTLVSVVGTDGSVQFTGLRGLHHRVRLSGLAPQCTPDQYLATITLSSGQDGDLSFAVDCPVPLKAGLVYWGFPFQQPWGLYRADGVTPLGTFLAPFPAAASDEPVLAPGGTRWVIRDRRGDIVVMNLDGSRAVNLTAKVGRQGIMFVWSPDGSQIAFKDNLGGIGIVAADGSSHRVFPGSAGTWWYPAAWSPDGRYLLTIRTGQEHGQQVSALDRMDLAAAGTTRLRTASSGLEITAAGYSRSGQAVTFAEGTYNAATLYRVPAAGGTPAPLLSGIGGRVWEVAWSRDDGELASIADGPAGRSVQITDAAGSTHRDLTPGVYAGPWGVYWTP